MPDFVDTMAYAGEVPWHRLGKHVGDNNVTGAEMIAAAEMDWTVSKVPVYYDSDGNGRREVCAFPESATVRLHGIPSQRERGRREVPHRGLAHGRPQSVGARAAGR